MHPIVFPFRPTPLKGARAYALAFAATAAAAGLTLATAPLMNATPTALFFAAVTVSTWLGQVRHGVFSALLSALFLDYFLLKPHGHFSLDAASLLRTGMWLGVSCGVVFLVGKLQESQERIFAILSGISDGFLSIDREWKCAYANEQGAALLGSTPDALLGKTLWELFATHGASGMHEKCRQAVEEQQKMRCEEYYAPREAWYELTAFPSKTGLRLVLRDVTDRHTGEAERAKTEEILSRLPEGFAVMDRDWNFLYVNDRGAQLSGKSRDEMIGKNCWELFPRALGTVIETEYLRCVREGVPVHFELPLLRQGLSFEIRAYPLADGISVVYQDVTEARERETQLRSALDRLEIAHNAANIGTWDWNIRSGELIWSDNIAPIHGLDPQQFDGKLETWLKTIHPDDLPMVQANIQKAIAERSDYYVEFRTIWADGKEHWVSGQGKVIVGADGQPERMVGIGADIDRRRREEEALRRSEKLAAAGRLAATIAHEINNPLEAVTNLIYLMRQDGSISAETQELLTMAEEQLARVNHIARQTLAFYRERTIPEMVDAAQTFDELLTILQSRLTAKHVIVEKQFEDVQPLRAFRGEVRQVLSNLLTNAIDASPLHSKLIVRVKPGPALDHGHPATILMEVEDFGHGIRPEDRERIFEPFFTTKSDVGTGLGLWVSRQIVEKHGGTLDFRTCLEEGSTGTCFSMVLPVRAEEVSSASMQYAS
ncbi:MAG TPA: PAS domain-containing protein [Candidatus Angelobacter sp.]